MKNEKELLEHIIVIVGFIMVYLAFNIKNENNMKKRKRLKKGKSYFLITELGIGLSEDFGESEDDFCFDIGNYYITYKECEKMIYFNKSIVKINDRINELNEGWVPNWQNPNENKYFIYYDYYNKEFSFDLSNLIKHPFLLFYIKTPEIALQVIDEFFCNELKILFNIK